MAFFPLVWFFGGLFYTDVWSLIFVIAGWDRVLSGDGWGSAGVGVSPLPQFPAGGAGADSNVVVALGYSNSVPADERAVDGVFRRAAPY